MKYIKLFEDTISTLYENKINFIEDWEEEDPDDPYDFIIIEYKSVMSENKKEYWLVLHSKINNEFYTFYDIFNKKYISDRIKSNLYIEFYIGDDTYVLVREIGLGVKEKSSSVKKGKNINTISNPLNNTYDMNYLLRILPNITYDSTPLWDYIKNEK